MKALKQALGVAFGMTALLGTVFMGIIAAYKTAWVLYPVALVAIGLVSYFLLEEEL